MLFKKEHKRHPTYLGCSAAEEWHLFSNFKRWMETQDWEGKDLDKDIIEPDNKIYGPDFCVFVDPSINTLLLNANASRGKYKIGVCYIEKKGKFKSQIKKHGKKLFLGYYDTEDEAHKAYIKSKSDHLKEIAKSQTEKIMNGLIRHAERLDLSIR